MHYVPTFLRPLTQADTGLESRVEEKAENVESIESQSSKIEFRNDDEVPVWRNKDALRGKTELETDKLVKTDMGVDHPKRHWWVVTDGILEEADPPIGNHADIFDLITAINLCIDGPAFFSQSPGQVVSGAYQVEDGALKYRDLSIGSFVTAIRTNNDIPQQIQVSESVGDVYEMVRHFRSTQIESDEDMDIRVGLHMYDDALTSSLLTTMSNLLFVCENALCSGRSTNVDDRIAEVTDMDIEGANKWKNTVNRLKHPDKGETPGSMIRDDPETPTLRHMRRTANTALIHTMKNRFSENGDQGV